MELRMDHRWNDNKCSRQRAYVCEGDAFPPSAPPPPPVPPRLPPPSAPPGTQRWQLDPSRSVLSVCISSNGAFNRGESCASSRIHGRIEFNVLSDDELRLYGTSFECHEELKWDVDLGFFVGTVCEPLNRREPSASFQPALTLALLLYVAVCVSAGSCRGTSSCSAAAARAPVDSGRCKPTAYWRRRHRERDV